MTWNAVSTKTPEAICEEIAHNHGNGGAHACVRTAHAPCPHYWPGRKGAALYMAHTLGAPALMPIKLVVLNVNPLDVHACTSTTDSHPTNLSVLSRLSQPPRLSTVKGVYHYTIHYRRCIEGGDEPWDCTVDHQCGRR